VAFLGTIAALCITLYSRPIHAYSVLAHESVIDSAWDDLIAPMLRARFPRADAAAITEARAYAYGGSVVQDLGYYPFGSHFFTNLLHYTRSGDFVETMLRDAGTIDEYAFALGALAHYTSDTTGHPLAVNRSVPLIYPKLRAKFGDDVTYVEDPKRHIMVEFAFDVVQVARGAYLPESYRDFIGFKVATDLLERAFEETYGLEMKDLFASEDLAIGTFRYAVGSAIPQMTRIAWEKKRDDIEKLAPNVPRNAFVFTYTRTQYDKEFGTQYKRPGIVPRVLVWFFRVLPKVGPLQALAFKVPTPDAERLFADSFKTACDRYRARLEATRNNRLNLANADFDTGVPTRLGEYPLADESYAELLHRLVSKKPMVVPDAMRRNIIQFYAAIDRQQPRNKKERKQLAEVKEDLATLTH